MAEQPAKEPEVRMTQAEVLDALDALLENCELHGLHSNGDYRQGKQAFAAVAALYEAQAALLFERDECAAACDRETVAYNLARQEISTLHSAIETTRAMASNAAYARDEMRQRLRGVQELCDVNSGIVDAVREALGLKGKPGDVVERAAALYEARAWRKTANERPTDGQFVAYYFEPFSAVYFGTYEAESDSVLGRAGFTTMTPEVPLWFALPPIPEADK
jgi:hypothetical protein